MIEQELRDEFEKWKAQNISETQSILIHDLCNRALEYGYSLAQETIERQKKQIEGKSHLLSIAIDQVKAKDAEMLKAREIVSGFWAWFHIKSTRTAPIEFLEKAKAWLESNK